MNKINKKIIIIFFIIGMVLGFVSEYALIFDIKWIIKITQSFIFWGILMLIISILSKEYITSILSSSLSMITMNATYYLIRLSKSGYTNVAHWNLYNLIGIAGSIYISMCIYCIKGKIINKSIKDNIPKYSIIFMTIFFILFIIIDEYCFWHNTINPFSYFYFLFGHMIYMISGSIGILAGAIIGTIIGNYFNKKQKLERNTIRRTDSNIA